MPDANLTPVRLLANARAMRRDPTATEAKLWAHLRDRRLGGYKFRRQRPAPPFIADFCCLAVRLVVEVDDDSHGVRAEYDHRRTRHLERDGHHVIRFTNNDVFHNPAEVLEEILRECKRLDGSKSPSP